MKINPVILKQYDDAPEDLVVYTCNMKDVVGFFNSKNIKAEFVDDSKVNPSRALIIGSYLNIEFHADNMDRIHGESAFVYCTINYKNGSIALPFNNFAIDAEKYKNNLSEMIWSYYLMNSDKLQHHFINHSALTSEQIERMANNGFLVKDLRDFEEESFDYDFDEEE